MHKHSPQTAPHAPKTGQRGSVLLYLIVGLVAFGVLAMAGATRFSSVVSSVLAPNCATSARYMAESGLRYAMARLRACTTESCVEQAATAMNNKVVIINAARGQKFTLQAAYDDTTRSATVTSTGNGCTNITASTKTMTASVNLPALEGGDGDIDFGNLGEDFTITSPTGGSSPITVDADGKLVFLGVIGDDYNSAAIWYTSNNTYCTNGSCTMTYGLRAYFEAQWDLSSIADGIVFAIKSATTNAILSAGGDPYKAMGEVMGWAGPGPNSLGYTGIKPPKIGLELDTWRNNDGSTIYNADSRADKNYVNTNDENRNSDHLAFVFWGSTVSTYISTGWHSGFNTATYDDNRHATSFSDSDAGDDSSTQPRSYQDLDGTGDGRWGYYYRKAASTWLRDGTKHLIRFELWRMPNYPNAQGNYPYLLKAWVRSTSPGTGYADVTADYSASPPDLYRAIFLSSAMHNNLAKIMLGFTEATGSQTQRVTVSGLKVSFRKTEGTPTMPADHVAYFPMSEGSGTTVSDSHGASATFYGGATWVTGCTKCPAVAFNGVNGVLHAANSPATAPSTHGTVTAWYYMPTLGLVDAGLVHKGNQINFSDESYSLQMTGFSKLGLYILNDKGKDIKVDTSITADSTWHHVAATWTPTELLIYIDGELKGRTANTKAYAARATTGGLNIGAQTISTSPLTVGQPFLGRISRVAIYNRALTPLEIANMAVAH